MKARDVIAQLLACLPQETDRFTDTIPMSAAAHVEPTLTISTVGAHGLVAGNLFHLVGVHSPIPVSSFTRSGTTGTIVFSRAHDRTLESFRPTLEITGANEASFNGIKTIVGVPNRTTIEVAMTNSGPTSATGTIFGRDVDSIARSYSRMYAVDSVIDADTLTAETTIVGASGPDITQAELRVRPRVSGAVDLDRAIEAYTKQGAGKFWAFVVLGDVQASRGQEHRSEGVDRQACDQSYRQQVVVPFSVVVIAPAKDDIAARRVRDEMVDLWRPLCRCLLGKQFESALGFTPGGAVNFKGHGPLEYEKSFYAHGFAFEATEVLGFDDTIGYSESVAFRDIDYTIIPDLDADQGAGSMSGTIDLDEEP